MRRIPEFNFFSSSTTTANVIYSFFDDHSAPTHTKQIPIHSSSDDHQPPLPIPIPVHLPPQSHAAATKIQSAYRAHFIRTLYRIISSVNSQADDLQRRIQLQETVDAIRADERQKLRMNEALMGLLLRLDSVPGVDPTVREARRKVSRRIVGLQEILDGICEAEVDGTSGNGGFVWDKVLGEMEEEVCRERGGDEMERFCAEYLGFRCLQRFLREP